MLTNLHDSKPPLTRPLAPQCAPRRQVCLRCAPCILARPPGPRWGREPIRMRPGDQRAETRAAWTHSLRLRIDEYENGALAFEVRGRAAMRGPCCSTTFATSTPGSRNAAGSLQSNSRLRAGFRAVCGPCCTVLCAGSLRVRASGHEGFARAQLPELGRSPPRLWPPRQRGPSQSGQWCLPGATQGVGRSRRGAGGTVACELWPPCAVPSVRRSF